MALEGGYLVKLNGADHLPTTKDGKPDHGLMGAAWAALHGGYRGQKYEGPDKEAGIAKLKKLYESEKIPCPPVTMSVDSLTLSVGMPISNGAKPEQKTSLPKALKVLNLGANSTRKGIVRVGERTRQLLALNQTKYGYDQVALDYEHNTVFGTPAYKESKEPRAVAGFFKPELREDGLWIACGTYTPDGVENALNFPDLSPCVQLDENGEVVFLHSVALCRQGAVDGLGFYSVDLPSVGRPRQLND